MAMLVTTILSMVLFGLAPSLQLYLGIITASLSLSLYYMPPSLLFSTDPRKSKDPLLPITDKQ